MSLFDIIYYIVIEPLKLVFGIIFSLASRINGYNNITEYCGFSIIVLSLSFNFLVLPLYLRADAIQEEEKRTQERLSETVKHIRKTFSGDERMLMLSTYYRQNNYKPAYAVKSAASLLLQIPFFIAAYDFLSNLDVLNGASFGPIKDLGAPDGLLNIAGISVNLLPVLMTLINVVSSVIYSKGYPLKNKIQMYAIALFFLVFLYGSPSGLVFYWTLNNLFSLIKNIVYKIRNRRIVLSAASSAAGAALFFLCFTDIIALSPNRIVFLAVSGALLQCPLLLYIFRGRIGRREKEKTYAPSKTLFIVSSLFLAVLTGSLIPSAVISASPQEFLAVNNYRNPVWLTVSSFCIGLGLFFLWVGVYYSLSNDKWKTYIERAIAVLCPAFLVNYLFFGKDLGLIRTNFTYESEMLFSRSETVLDLIAVSACIAVMIFLTVRFSRLSVRLISVCLAAIIAMSFWNSYIVTNSISSANEKVSSSTKPSFQLSRNGKNVVIIMLDRALGVTLPYIFNEKPELKEKYAGFTYYNNTISYGAHTNLGAPALYGGYEYTPTELNSRDDESLLEKNNESILMLPVLFSSNGYNVTVFDPPYGNYQWLSDLSIYDDYPGINAYNTSGTFTDQSSYAPSFTRRNLFCYGLSKTLALPLQMAFYDHGNYYNPGASNYLRQIQRSLYVSEGVEPDSINTYTVLENFSNMTVIDDNGSDNFLFLRNMTAHSTMLLQEPDYIPSVHVDNTAFEAENSGRFTLNGKQLHIKNIASMSHYQCNMAAMLLIGNWLDHLRENDLYDNTRIVIVADHGHELNMLDDLKYDFGDESCDVSAFFPLLMYKDFEADEFSVSEEFMTNADVPFLAVNRVIEEPVNPFTGRVIDNGDKYAHDQYIIDSDEWDVYTNNGNAFLPGRWYSVHDSIWDRKNWQKVADDSVLTNDVY